MTAATIGIGSTMKQLARALAFVFVPVLCGPALADAVSIVAVEASNTSGFNVGEKNAYPARLESLLRARGIDAVGSMPAECGRAWAPATRQRHSRDRAGQGGAACGRVMGSHC